MAKGSLTEAEIDSQVQAKPKDCRFRDIEGCVFGRITVGRFCGMKSGSSRWECTCDCGARYITSYAVLKNPQNVSCGCYKNHIRGKASITHGMTESSEYEIWCGMKKRCTCKSNSTFANYGGRGISVCEKWTKSFEEFIRDVGPRPSRRHTIDRIDNDGDYEPGNVRWATPQEQARNRRSTKIIEAFGEQLSLIGWADRSGISWSTINARLKAGWTPEKAVSNPLSTRGKRGSSPLGYVGVSKSGNKFRARIRVNGRNVSLGHFDTALDAGKAYLRAEAELKSVG